MSQSQHRIVTLHMTMVAYDDIGCTMELTILAFLWELYGDMGMTILALLWDLVYDDIGFTMGWLTDLWGGYDE